ncbi:GFA family protein [Paraburkholderia sp. EG285A]|uniref:GFA family protein n=2 Tax=Paraburkholderia TaxID=1822464 RepID=UPI0034D35BB3
MRKRQVAGFQRGIRQMPVKPGSAAGGNSDVTVPFSGGCACGAIRYVCSRVPVATLNCHCLDCQRSSGAPFASGFIVRVSDVTITGTPNTYSVRAGSGRLATRSFCADCGSPLFTQGEAAPEVMSIRFPTLDNPSEFQPMLDIWTSSAQPWVCLSQAIPHYPQSP